MSFEFNDAEMMECARCGEWLPGDEMVFLDDGTVLCQDCWNALLDEEEAEEENDEECEE